MTQAEIGQLQKNIKIQTYEKFKNDKVFASWIVILTEYCNKEISHGSNEAKNSLALSNTQNTEAWKNQWHWEWTR